MPAGLPVPEASLCTALSLSSTYGLVFIKGAASGLGSTSKNSLPVVYSVIGEPYRRAGRYTSGTQVGGTRVSGGGGGGGGGTGRLQRLCLYV